MHKGQMTNIKDIVLITKKLRGAVIQILNNCRLRIIGGQFSGKFPICETVSGRPNVISYKK